MVRILLADDHEMIRRGLRGLIESAYPGWEVCGEASNGRDAVELAVRLKPDVAVLDLTMHDMGGLEASRHIRRLVPATEILIYSMFEDRHHIQEAAAAGAKGYVPKSEPSEHLLAAIEAVARHDSYFSGDGNGALVARLIEEDAAGESPLTPRQVEVAQLLATGHSNKQIASTMGISVNTVKTHRAAIMRKLDASSIVDVVHWAMDQALVESRS